MVDPPAMKHGLLENPPFSLILCPSNYLRSIYMLVGGLDLFYFSIYCEESSQLTNSYFSEIETTNQYRWDRMG
jgi:hypothetical protein